MVEPTPRSPQVSQLQRLWLQELGLDKPMLARLAPQAARFASQASGLSSRASRPAPEASGLPPQDSGLASRAARSASGAAALAALRQGTGTAGPAAKRSTPSASQAATVSRAPALTPPPGVAQSGSGASTHPVLGQGPAAGPGSTNTDTHTDARRESVTANVTAEGAPTDWAELEARIQACEACELHGGRHRAVAGSGAVQAVDWLVVGEAPGERDDRLGQPFQGKAGELLHAMLAAAGIDPEHAVFYTNLVKCRPRSNRLPTPDEIASCLPHLHSQIALLRPKGILALGRLAAQALLGEGDSNIAAFEALRGQVHQFQGHGGTPIPLVVTYHPASLLSRPRHKAASWRDLNVARTVGINQ